MFSFRLVSLPVCWLLLISLLWGPASGGYTLCLGTDGHRHVEVEAQGGCSVADTHAPQRLADDVTHFDPTDSHCGPCLDVALSHDQLQERQRLLQLAAPQLPALTAPLIALPTLVPRLNAELLACQSLHPPRAHLALRSTVLRC